MLFQNPYFRRYHRNVCSDGYLAPTSLTETRQFPIITLSLSILYGCTGINVVELMVKKMPLPVSTDPPLLHSALWAQNATPAWLHRRRQLNRCTRRYPEMKWSPPTNQPPNPPTETIFSSRNWFPSSKFDCIMFVWKVKRIPLISPQPGNP